MAANPSNQARQFHLFPLLPQELREAIWKASFKPRIVYLTPTILKPGFSARVRSDTTIDDEAFFDWEGAPPPPQLSFRSRSMVPALYVCHESRHMATNVYTLAFGPTYYPCTWFDFKNDTLYVDWVFENPEPEDEDEPNIFETAYNPRDLGPDLGKVEKLAVCDGLPGSILKENGMDHVDWIRILFRELYSIKTVTVVDRAHGIIDSENLVSMYEVCAIDKELDMFKQMSEFTHDSWQEREDIIDEYLQNAYYDQFNAYEDAADGLRSNRLNLGQCFRRSCTRVHWQPKPPATKFEIPAIKHATITSAKKRDTYLEVKRLYSIEKDLRNVSLMVLPVGCKNTVLSFEYLMLAVPGSTTLQEVIELCRRLWKIPFYWQHDKTTYKLQEDALPVESTLHDLGIRTGTRMLRVKFGGLRIENDGD